MNYKKGIKALIAKKRKKRKNGRNGRAYQQIPTVTAGQENPVGGN